MTTTRMAMIAEIHKRQQTPFAITSQAKHHKVTTAGGRNSGLGRLYNR